MTHPTAQAHTPGPWKHRAPMSPWIDGANGEPIARVYQWAGVSGDGRLPRSANAALIARAPELLAQLSALHAREAQLVEALRELLSISESTGDEWNGSMRLDDALDAARALLSAPASEQGKVQS